MSRYNAEKFASEPISSLSTVQVSKIPSQFTLLSSDLNNSTLASLYFQTRRLKVGRRFITPERQRRSKAIHLWISFSSFDMTTSRGYPRPRLDINYLSNGSMDHLFLLLHLAIIPHKLHRSCGWLSSTSASEQKYADEYHSCCELPNSLGFGLTTSMYLAHTSHWNIEKQNISKAEKHWEIILKPD